MNFTLGYNLVNYVGIRYLFAWERIFDGAELHEVSFLNPLYVYVEK